MSNEWFYIRPDPNEVKDIGNCLICGIQAVYANPQMRIKLCGGCATHDLKRFSGKRLCEAELRDFEVARQKYLEEEEAGIGIIFAGSRVGKSG